MTPPKGAVESADQLLSFTGELAQHPIDTTCQICKSFGTLASMTCSGEWKELSRALAPEVCDLVQKWDTLPSREQGELAGYLVGKYGGDILIPGAAAKVLSSGIKGVKEIAAIQKNLQLAEKTYALEALQSVGEVATVRFSEQTLCKQGLRESYQRYAVTTAAQQVPPTLQEIIVLENQISNWLGEGTRLIHKKSGDSVFISKDGLRCVRFDILNPHGDAPHMHIEQFINGEWQDATSQHRIYCIHE